MTRIVIKKSSVAGKVPSPTDLVMGELAVNVTDKTLYTKDSNGNIVPLNSSSSNGAPSDATYLTLSTNPTLTNERVLTPSQEFLVTDGGPNGNYDLKINNISGKKIQGKTVYNKSTVNCGIIIPFYQYPSDIYTNENVNFIINLKKKYQDVPVTVVVNPSSGPGTEIDNNYFVLIKRLIGAGITVVAYVYTSYGSRPLVDVQNDINTYSSLYPFDSVHGQYGIFLDEMSNDTSTTNLEYYKNIKEFAHKRGFYPVIGNPGTNLPPSIFKNESCDEYVIYEDEGIWPSENYLKGDYGDNYSEYDFSQRTVIVIDVPFDAEKIQMISRYCGNLYLTDQPIGSAFSKLPSYLENIFVLLSDKTVHKNLGLVQAARLNMLMP